MKFFEKLKLMRLLNKARNQIMWEKLQKTELWVTVFSAALLALMTNVGLEADLAAKLIATLAATYAGSRGLAKVGQDK